MKTNNIALVAHDGRKKELLEWVTYNLNELKKHNLYATGTTGKLIKEISVINVIEDYKQDFKNEEYSDTYPSAVYEVPHWKEYPLADKVTCLKSGPLGGDQQIGAMIAEGKIDVLIFFCDNLITQGHQTDVSALTRLASLYNIAFATNRTTADMILTSPLFTNENYKPVMPENIEAYKNRDLF